MSRAHLLIGSLRMGGKTYLLQHGDDNFFWIICAHYLDTLKVDVARVL